MPLSKFTSIDHLGGFRGAVGDSVSGACPLTKSRLTLGRRMRTPLFPHLGVCLACFLLNVITIKGMVHDLHLRPRLVGYLSTRTYAASLSRRSQIRWLPVSLSGEMALPF